MLRSAVLTSALLSAAILCGCSGGAENGDSDASGTGGATNAGSKPDTKGWIIHAEKHPNPSVAYRWLDVIQEAAARRIDKVGARPTVIAREMMIACTAMYDAWAAYDDKAVGTRLKDKLRRPKEERTQKNKEIAIGYAVHRALCYVFWDDIAWLEEQARAMGIDPANTSTDLSSPAGVGNTAAAAVIEYRKSDGANQDGKAPGCSGQPYSDYTGYKCVNPDPNVIVDPDCWQPIPWSDGKGGTTVKPYLTPHWGEVKTIGLDRNDQFRAPPPPKVGSEQLKKEVDELIEMNATLSLDQKAIVEFMRDGPRSTGQSGHWLRFAADLSRRDKYDLDKDVKLFFAIAAVAHDAFVSCWETKRYYNTSRPWTLVRYYYKGKKIRGYAGPGKGVMEIPAEQWHPYSPEMFVTPPFPAYTSGHATVSGASAKILELFSGSDRYECIERRKPGELTENFGTDVIMAVDGVVPKDVPKDYTAELLLPTFSATAEMAATSRALGGYHIMTDNSVGLECGRKLAVHCWKEYQKYFDGTAEPKK